MKIFERAVHMYSTGKEQTIDNEYIDIALQKQDVMMLERQDII